MVLATTQQPHTQTRHKRPSHNKTHPTGNKQRSRRPTAIKRGRLGPYGLLQNPTQADHWRLRRRRSNTTRRARPGCNRMTATSDRPAATNLRTNREVNKDDIRWRGLRGNRPHDEQANRKPANTTMYRPNRCTENDPTINRPHASRPTPNQPGMQGLKRERRPMGRRHHGAPRPPTTIPTR